MNSEFILPKFSDEQKSIIDRLENHNIIVDSVAGSGKTTTNLYIASFYENKNILLLTYNAKLKLETRDRVRRMGIQNLETHSYHSFCVKNYHKTCYTDSEITNLLKTNNKSLYEFSYDIIILDEAQDITPLYYELICKIYKDNHKKARICILGDKYQSIYDFNNSDERFIVFADKLFNFNNALWKKCMLSYSFRTPICIANFINNCMLNYDRIKSSKYHHKKPRYIICNTFPRKFDDNDCKPFEEIKYYLNLNYSPEEIFILAPSLKSLKCPARLLENYIKTNISNIPIYVPGSDDEKLDETIIKNKMVFSTFHQAKGLERKVVIVFGFDNSYFKYYKQNKDPLICPNELYVATTRASECLTLLHHHTDMFLPFINQANLGKYTEFIGKLSRRVKKDIMKNDIDTQVTQLVKHLPQSVIDACYDYLTIKSLKPSNGKIEIATKIKNSDLYESVSEINGIAIPAYFEYRKTHKMSIYNFCLKPSVDIKKKENKLLFDFWRDKLPKLRRINLNKFNEQDLLYVANLYNSLNSKYLFKSYQIKDYDWLSKYELDLCYDRLNKLTTFTSTNDVIFEQECYIANRAELLNRKICGRYDCIVDIDSDTSVMYEFKCTSQLEKEHYLQLAIYMYIHKLTNKPKELGLQKYDKILCKLNEIIGSIVKRNFVDSKVIFKTETKECSQSKYYLYNILTDQLDEVICDQEDLIKMMEYLIYNKYMNNKKCTDEDFINNISMISSKF